MALKYNMYRKFKYNIHFVSKLRHWHYGVQSIKYNLVDNYIDQKGFKNVQ